METRKDLVIILLISLAFAIIFTLILKIDEAINEMTRAIIYLIAFLWSFGILPSFIYWFNRLKEKSSDKKVRRGLLFQHITYFIPFILAPFFMIKYVLATLENARNNN